MLTLFIEFLLRTFRAPRSVTNALAAIRNLHLQLDAPTQAFENYTVLAAVRALPLTLRHQPSPAPPATQHLLRLLARASQDFGLKGLIFFTLCTFAFHSLARLSSLVPPHPPFDATRYPTFGDVAVFEGGLLLTIKFAKNVQDAADSFTVPLLPASDPLICPVQAFQALRSAAFSTAPGAPLFLWPGSSGRVACCLTAPVARAFLHTLLHKAGLPEHSYTFHSFRRGGCTLAATRGAAIPDLQALGGWKSQAVHAYLPALPSQVRAASFLAA